MCDLDVHVGERCSKLYQELIKEIESSRKYQAGIKNCEAKLNILEQENAVLSDLVFNMEKNSTCQGCTEILVNKSSPLEKVGPRQRLRKMNELKTKAQRALWFLESYGVTAKDLVMEDSSGQEIELDIGSGNKRPLSKYKDLGEKEKVRIEEVLHILDTFFIGDASYHSLTQIGSGLPKSYLIKQCRNEVNGMFKITRPQGDLVGAQISFKDELTRTLKEKVSMEV